MPIGFGTWPIGGFAYGPVAEDRAAEVLAEAYHLGVRLFDTADIYGDGRAERIIGRSIVGRADALVVTKIGYLSEVGTGQDFDPSYLDRAADASRRRLGCDRVDVLLLHSPPPEVLTDHNVLYAAERLQARGATAKLGVSLRSLDSLAAALSWPACEVVEVVLNLLDQRAIDCGLVEQSNLGRVDVIARVPLCFGLLTGSYSLGTRFDAPDQRHRWSATQLDSWIGAADRFRFLERVDRSLTQGALAFIAGLGPRVFPIPGAKSLAQVRENSVATAPIRALDAREMLLCRDLWGKLRDVPPR